MSCVTGETELIGTVLLPVSYFVAELFSLELFSSYTITLK